MHFLNVDFCYTSFGFWIKYWKPNDKLKSLCNANYLFYLLEINKKALTVSKGFGLKNHHFFKAQKYLQLEQ